MNDSNDRPKIRVAILMGSDSDLPVMRKAADVLARFSVPHEVRVLSAHRSPGRTAEYVAQSTADGVEVFIAGAGMAAHLAGAVAAHTPRPVIGVPLTSSKGLHGGVDALYATVMMPPGVPVATVGVDGARNAGVLAVQILALGDPELADALDAERQRMADGVAAKNARLAELGVERYLDSER